MIERIKFEKSECSDDSGESHDELCNSGKEEMEPEEENQDSEWCPYCDGEAHDESDCPACATWPWSSSFKCGKEQKS